MSQPPVSHVPPCSTAPFHIHPGYDTPQNLANYAKYLDTRIRAYRDLKHDAVRVQAESNRDLRASEEEARASGSQSQLQRSKTTTGRKLRVMTVEKGLLRETKIVQEMIDALLECRVSVYYGPHLRTA